MKNYVLGVMLAIVFMSSFGYAQETKTAVMGTAEFAQQIGNAMTLLKTKDPAGYRFVQQHLGVIEQRLPDALFPHLSPPLLQLSNETAYYSLSWCAASLGYYAYHVKLYRDYGERYGEPVPEEVWSGKRAQEESFLFQKNMLKRLGASPQEIDYLSVRELQGVAQ